VSASVKKKVKEMGKRKREIFERRNNLEKEEIRKEK
jgi:hypothetical protein